MHPPLSFQGQHRSDGITTFCQVSHACISRVHPHSAPAMASSTIPCLVCFWPDCGLISCHLQLPQTQTFELIPLQGLPRSSWSQVLLLSILALSSSRPHPLPAVWPESLWCSCQAKEMCYLIINVIVGAARFLAIALNVLDNATVFELRPLKM